MKIIKKIKKSLEQGWKYFKNLEPKKKKKVVWGLAGLGTIILVYGIFQYWKIQKHNKELANAPVKAVLVNIHDEKGSTPAEDARMMKKGNVIAIFPENHSFSDTEKISFLILKMKLTPEWEKKLMEPVLGPPSKEKQAAMDAAAKAAPGGGERRMNERDMQETVKARKYRINLEKLNFDPADLYAKQPFEGRILDDWSIEEN